MLYVCNIVKEAAFRAGISKNFKTYFSSQDIQQRKMNTRRWQKTPGDLINVECEGYAGYSASRFKTASIKHYNQTRFPDVANPKIHFRTTADSATNSNWCRIPACEEPIASQRRA